MSMTPTNATSAMQALFQFAGLQPSLFASNSRYLGIPTATFVAADGSTIAYVRRRFIPQPGQLAQLQQYSVVQGDRLDVLAAKFLGDPQLFWRICDANGAMRPEDLIFLPQQLTSSQDTALAVQQPAYAVGKVLRICLPANIPGGPIAS
ncbi:MAG: LysM domain-containing protein [Candidatus Angelobacter sp.]